MPLVVVDGGKVVFTTPTNDGAIVTAPAPFEKVIAVTSGGKLTGQGNLAALQTDIMAIVFPVTGITYSWAPAFPTPGTASLAMTVLTSGLSTKLKKGGVFVVLASAIGTYTITPDPGAGASHPGPPITYDPTPHIGAWSIGAAGQIKLTAV